LYRVGDWYLNVANGDVYEKTGAAAWTLRDNLTGPQGIQGIQGIKGDKGDKGDQGIQGIQGIQGDKGWSPILALITDGARRVLQVIDWAGGAGTKPATGSYIGATGLVSNIAQAIDIRGPAGPPVSANSIDNTLLADMATATIKGRVTAGIGDPEDLTAAQARSVIGVLWREIYSIRTAVAVSAIIIPIPTDVYKLHIEASCFATVADSFVMGRISQDGGATYLSAADAYRTRYGGNSTNTMFASNDVQEAYMRVGAAAGAAIAAISSIEVDVWNDTVAGTKATAWRSEHSGFHSTNAGSWVFSTGYCRVQTARPTHLMLFPLSGQIAAGSTVFVEGR
jgi:hypothetical protein